MIGQVVPVGDARPVPAAELAQLKEWWHTHVTWRLLQDHLAWRATRPESWNRASLLLHAWKSRGGGFLRTGGEG